MMFDPWRLFATTSKPELLAHSTAICSLLFALLYSFSDMRVYQHIFKDSKEESTITFRTVLWMSISIIFPSLFQIFLEVNVNLKAFRGLSTTRKMSLTFWLSFVNGFVRYTPLQIILFPVAFMLSYKELSFSVIFSLVCCQLMALSYFFAFSLIDRRSVDFDPLFTPTVVSGITMLTSVTYLIFYLILIEVSQSALIWVYFALVAITTLGLCRCICITIRREPKQQNPLDISPNRSLQEKTCWEQFVHLASYDHEFQVVLTLTMMYASSNIVSIGYIASSFSEIEIPIHLLVHDELPALVAIATISTVIWTVVGDRKLRHEMVNMQAAKRLNRGFVRFISHELRSPLNHQVLGLQMLYDDLASDGRMQSKLRDIAELQDTCESSLQILNDILVFDELSNACFCEDASSSSSRPKIIPLEPFMHETVKRFRNKVSGDGVKYHIEMDFGPCYTPGDFSPRYSTKPLLLVDKVELKCVLKSLIRNAERASPVNGTVSIRATLASNNAVAPSNLTGSFNIGTNFNGNGSVLQRSISEDCEMVFPAKPTTPYPASTATASVTENSSKERSMSIISDIFGSSFGIFKTSVSSRGPTPKVSIVPTANTAIINAIKEVNSPSGSAKSLPSRDSAKRKKSFLQDFFSTNKDRGRSHGLIEAGTLRIEIIDQGAGMSISDQKKLMKKSLALAPDDLQCGQAAGLRITIARAILERYGGMLTVESPGINQGCTFTAHIPYYYQKKGMSFGNGSISTAIQNALNIVNATYGSQNGSLNARALDERKRFESPLNSHPNSVLSGGRGNSGEDSNSFRSSASTATIMNTFTMGNVSYGPGVGGDYGPLSGSTPINSICSNVQNNGNHDSSPKININANIRQRMIQMTTVQTPSTPDNNNNSNANNSKASIDESQVSNPELGNQLTNLMSPTSTISSVGTKSPTENTNHHHHHHHGSNKVYPYVKSQKLNVLVVDDVVSSRKILKKMITYFGHTVDEAIDGLDAVRMVELSKKEGNSNYHVVFMDCMMPRMDGPTAARQMKALGYSGIIIGFTGVSSYDTNRFLSFGAHKMLEKPLKIAHIETVLQDICIKLQSSAKRDLNDTLSRTIIADDTQQRQQQSSNINDNNNNSNGSSNPSQPLSLKLPNRGSSSNLESPRQGSSTTNRPLHFLVVDDVPSNRKMVCRLLSRKGFTCEEACDGLDAFIKVSRSVTHGTTGPRSEASFSAESTTSSVAKITPLSSLDTVHQIAMEAQMQEELLNRALSTIPEKLARPFDGIIMDFVMPNLDGPTACKRIRSELNYHKPIIGVTGNVLSSDVETFVSHGANRVIGKPLKMELFEETLRELFPHCSTLHPMLARHTDE